MLARLVAASVLAAATLALTGCGNEAYTVLTPPPTPVASTTIGAQQAEASPEPSAPAETSEPSARASSARPTPSRSATTRASASSRP